jgi:hypothetical protein
MTDDMPDENNHGFAEQDFQEIPEETDEDGEQYHHFFIRPAAVWSPLLKPVKVKTEYSAVYRG